MDAINFNFLCNNVEGLLTCKKRLKLFKYFKNKIFPNGILFLQETHSTKENKIKWKNDLTVTIWSNGVTIGVTCVQ